MEETELTRLIRVWDAQVPASDHATSLLLVLQEMRLQLEAIGDPKPTVADHDHPWPMRARRAEDQMADLMVRVSALEAITATSSVLTTGPVTEPLPSSTAQPLTVLTASQQDALTSLLREAMRDFSKCLRPGLSVSAIDLLTSTALKSILPLLTRSSNSMAEGLPASGRAPSSDGE